MKLIVFIAAFLIAVSAASLACDYSFCTEIVCSFKTGCADTCDGTYWYSEGSCYNCFFDDSKHCGYTYRDCADNDDTDGFPEGETWAMCGAECDQNSDCTCQESGCVGADYYDYVGSCSEGCACSCETVITANDARCPVCDEDNVDCFDPVCYDNPACTACEGDNLNCDNPACSGNINCLACDLDNVDCSIPACDNELTCLACDLENVNCTIPACSGELECILCDLNNVNCTLPSCFNEPACLACDDENTNCDNPACANSPLCLPCNLENVNCTLAACSTNELCLPCDISNINCSLPSCSNELPCLACDPNNVNCTIPACSSYNDCAEQPSGGVISYGGGGGGGFYLPPVKTNPSVCGDGNCTLAENCTSCPDDCKSVGQVCCSGIAINGDCCTDYDCGSGYACSISNKCVQDKANATPQDACNESWICSDWACTNGDQVRTCVDANECGTIEQIPQLVEECSQAPTGLFLLGEYDLLIALAAIGMFLLFVFLKKRSKKKA